MPQRPASRQDRPSTSMKHQSSDSMEDKDNQPPSGMNGFNAAGKKEPEPVAGGGSVVLPSVAGLNLKPVTLPDRQKSAAQIHEPRRVLSAATSKNNRRKSNVPKPPHPDAIAAGSIRPAHSLQPVNFQLLGSSQNSNMTSNEEFAGWNESTELSINKEASFGSAGDASNAGTGGALDDSQNSAVNGRSHESQSDDDEDDQETMSAAVVGGYDADEYKGLPVDDEIKELFGYIESYHAQTIEIEPVLKPFVLDFVPAVGDIDAFIKIPRPDEIEDNLGLIVLDEPCAKQSDPTVLDMHLRAVTKDVNVHKEEVIVKKLDRADKKSREIEQWITNIGELHKAKPATTVQFSRPMPDIEQLMQEWPPELEDLLKKVELPAADMDLDLNQYVDVICAILDIPVHKSRIHSLYQLFSLYLEFKNSAHFKLLADENKLESQEQAPEPRGPYDPETIETSSGKRTDRLEL